MVRPQRYPNVKPLELFPCCHKLIRRATDLFGLAPQPAAALNVILRRYLPGDWLGRHVDDVRMFAEPVFSTVLEVGGPRDGLIFTLPESEHGLEAGLSFASGCRMPLSPCMGASFCSSPPLVVVFVHCCSSASSPAVGPGSPVLERVLASDRELATHSPATLYYSYTYVHLRWSLRHVPSRRYLTGNIVATTMLIVTPSVA
ncbi:unnamed protein product [Prorocentrum cordatum]|uniref:Alpha-ketoglutarate-dependent dioxygenase AlkB-like domain-containing protein n=1 Tax=Prorocentrum cordatum TaxID=2364126 RepID=A0ABN9SL93_9DINO|nr:unnamed protein product [Polarella glacialis]